MRMYINYCCAILLGILVLSACNNGDGNDDTNGQSSKIHVYGVTSTRSLGEDDSKLVFSGDNIEWFNPETREIKFKGIEPSSAVFPVYSKIAFKIDGKTLFIASSFVEDSYSQIFNDLVIYYSIEKGKYYLDDCYPSISEVRNQEVVKQNIINREIRWKEFVNTLNSEKKIKK